MFLREIFHRRMVAINSLLFLSFFILLARIFYLQFVDSECNEKYRKRAKSQHDVKEILKPVRGSILDINGTPLALSLNVYTLKVIPFEIKNKPETAKLLAQSLKQDPLAIKKKIFSDKKCVYLKRKLSEEEYKSISKQKLPGVYFDKETKRVYPKGTLASHIVGFVGMDPMGLEGIEMYYDDELCGVEGYRSIVRDAKSFELIGLKEKIVQPRDGYNIYLTIDETIQYITEREIEAVYQKYHPLSVSAIVMDPKTGYILAMANLPNYDPNSVGSNFNLVRNRAITDSFEPGSTFKIVTIAGALNEGTVTRDKKVFCENGSFMVKGRTKPLHDHRPHGWLTVAEVVQKSSNIGTVKVAMEMGKDKLYKYIKLFGFGENSGIDLPGEFSGIVRNVKRWTESSISAIPMGQEVGATALQVTSAMSAIANKGILMRPRIVKEIRNTEGVVVKRFEPEPRERSISEETAAQMVDMLVDVVSDRGTASLAKIDNIKVAGKTGTSQKYDFLRRCYSHEKFFASFVGFLPADDPKLCIFIGVDEPPASKYFGGVIAAPIFRNIAKDTLVYLKGKS